MSDRAGNDRVEAVTAAIERLLKVFALERFAYLAFCTLSVLALFACVVILLVRTNGSALPEVIGMFGASGIITFSIGQVLRMWSQALAVVEKVSDAASRPTGAGE